MPVDFNKEVGGVEKRGWTWKRGHSWVKGLSLSHRARNDNDGDNGTGIYGEYHGVAFGVEKKVRGAAIVRDSHIWVWVRVRACVCVFLLSWNISNPISDKGSAFV